MGEFPKELHEILPFWNKLNPAQQEFLEHSAVLRQFRKGESVHQGGQCSGLLLIKSGQLRVYMLSEAGKEISLYRLFAWDICLFSASCIMKNISFDLHVQAEKDTQVWMIPAEIYENLSARSLPVADFTSQLMASRFSEVMWVMEQVLFSSFDSRLAAFLLEQRAIEESEVLVLTHEEIARNLGSAREVVTRMLNYFAAEGLVRLSRGKVEILDEKRLAMLTNS